MPECNKSGALGKSPLYFFWSSVTVVCFLCVEWLVVWLSRSSINLSIKSEHKIWSWAKNNRPLCINAWLKLILTSRLRTSRVAVNLLNFSGLGAIRALLLYIQAYPAAENISYMCQCDVSISGCIVLLRELSHVCKFFFPVVRLLVSIFNFLCMYDYRDIHVKKSTN